MIKAKIYLIMWCFILGIFIGIAGCAKPSVVQPPPAVSRAAIPARAAIAPLQFGTGIIEFPSGEQKNMAINTSLLNEMGKELEKFTRESGIFLKVIPLSEEILPSSPSIMELAQAGREKETDLVLVGKVIGFEGKPKYGFLGQSLVVQMGLEISLYETATGLRRWFSKERINVEKEALLNIWSDDTIESKYMSMLVNEAYPAILSKLIPKLHSEMADYKPPVVEKAVVAAADFVADVDRVPRVATEVKKNSFAVVIGIETYRDLPQAEFTVRDAKIMKEYLIRVMGFPEENIASLLNDRATKSDIEGYIGTWLKNNVERDSSVFIYYAGHGAPNPVTGEAFIIPFDGNPAFPEATGIPLKKFYEMLAELQVKDTFVVMDSCFSGSGGRSVMAKGGRPMAISVENPILANRNIVVMTAATGTEISSSYPEKRHGLFTYFFLKGLQGEADFNKDGTVSIGELYNYLAPQVKKIAKEKNMEQTPVLLPGIDLLENRANLPLGRTGSK